MNLEFLSREGTDKLAYDVQKNLDVYRSGETETLIKSSDCRVSRIEVGEPPSLDIFAEDKEDAEAAKALFQWLSNLTPVQASDERLWVLLTHRYFARYVRKRWGGTRFESATQPKAVVLDRWFFRGSGLRTSVHNAISRLWWFGHLTYDQTRQDPFELTGILLSLQDIQTAFLERTLGPCKPVLRAVLDALQKHQKDLQNTPKSGDVIKEWAKEIRLYGGAFVLDAVPTDRLAFVIRSKLRARVATAAL